jgi:hypothetical protein
MTMLMHTRDPFERARSSTARRDTLRQGAPKGHMATIKRLCIGALTVLGAGAALAAVIALKVALFFWIFHYS